MPTNLAIVIPYYKISFFKETLQSLADQTDQRFRVYIGNDASPEDPALLLKEFEGKFDFVYKRFDENLGAKSLTQQWERCIEMLDDEEWLLILGDDDYLSTNAVQEFYNHLSSIENENINVIKLNSSVINEEGKILSSKKPEPLLKSSIAHFFDKFIYEGRSSLSEHIFRRESYIKYRFKNLPVAWHSDDLALLEFSEFGNIFFIGDAHCNVRISEKSISGDRTKNQQEKRKATQEFLKIVANYHEKFAISEKRKLFDLIQWYEKEKDFEIYIPNKFLQYIRCYGVIKTLKLILF